MSIVDLMVPIFLAFREGLEAVLVIVIILLYLKNTISDFIINMSILGVL